MEPVIVEKPEIYLVGMSFYGDPFDTHSDWAGENEIGRVWTRFMRYLGENAEKIPPSAYEEAMYEVHVYNEETITKGLFEVFVGLQVENLAVVPLELVAKSLPATQYAVFTFEGEAISSDWHMEIDERITTAGYQRSHSFSFQYYDHRFKGVDNLAESVLDVYMPVKPQNPAPKPLSLALYALPTPGHLRRHRICRKKSARRHYRCGYRRGRRVLALSFHSDVQSDRSAYAL